MKRLVLILAVLLVASSAQACGPGPEMILIPLAALVWMIVLIPLELFILRRSAGFSNRQAILAYLATFVAKIAASAVAYSLLKYQKIGAFGVVDLLYSVIHGLISTLLLGKIFHRQGPALWRTSLLISTLIPWLYRFGLLVAWRILFGPPITFCVQHPPMVIGN